MDLVFLVVLGVAFLILIIEFVMRSAEANGVNLTRNGIPACPPHIWRYDEKTELFCEKCKKRPGSIHSNYDKPY